MLKDQFFKASGLHFDKWLFGSEKFSEVSRNKPLVIPFALGINMAVSHTRKNHQLVWC